MKSFSVALLFALLQQDCRAFVAVPAAQTAISRQQHQPLFISTELTAESSASASSSDDDNNEIKAIEIPVVEGGFTSPDADAAAPAQEETSSASAEAEAEEAPRHTLFIGNIPFGTCLSSSHSLLGPVACLAAHIML